MKTLAISIFLIISLATSAQQNQNIECSKIESGSFQVYKQTEKGYNKFVFEQAKKNQPYIHLLISIQSLLNALDSLKQMR